MKPFDFLLRKLRNYDAKRGYTCDFCGRELFEYPEKRLCERCLASLFYNDRYTCSRCGRKTVTEGFCLSCKQTPPQFTKGFSPLEYRGKSAALVNRLKNGNARLALFLGELMADCFLRFYTETTSILLLPVPLTKAKERERGYNQSELLCERISYCLEEQGFTIEYAPNLLVRKTDVQQKHLLYKERFQNAEQAYAIADRAACKGKTVLLVDDILTTGATGGACAKKLLKAGANAVFFLSAASRAEIQRENP